MNEVGIFNETNSEIKELEDLKKVIDKALEIENINNVEFNIIIVDNDRIHEINREYRNIDRPTDVISFALEDDESFPNLELRILGDIYISLDKVYEQSNAYGHSFFRELSFLTVHGILHLLGYDHMNEVDEKEMFSRQELILNEAGIKK